GISHLSFPSSRSLSGVDRVFNTPEFFYGRSYEPPSERPEPAHGLGVWEREVARPRHVHLRPRDLTAFNARDSLDQEVLAYCDLRAHHQRVDGIVVPDRDQLLQNDGAVIDLLVHEVNRHPSPGLAAGQDPKRGQQALVVRQQRAMDVDRPLAGDREDLPLEDLRAGYRDN